MIIQMRYILPLILIAAPALAVTVNDVCEALNIKHARSGSACRVYENRNFDPAALTVIREMANYNPANTLDSLHASADHRFNAEAAASCGAVARNNTLYGRFCLETIRDKTPSPLLSQIVSRLAVRAPQQAVDAFRDAGTAQIAAPLAAICLRLADVNPYQTLDCVKSIANKTIAPGAELRCLEPHTRSTDSMLACIASLPSNPGENCEQGGAVSSPGTGLSTLFNAGEQLQVAPRK